MPPLPVSPYLLTIILLIGSNTFMTAAWYWHLRFREVPLWQVILVSWGSPSSSIAWRCRPTAMAATSTTQRN